jgi:thiol-disulfide isomerase/thioredoxin
MKPLIKLSLPLFALAMLLGLTTLTQADDAEPTNAKITLDGVSLGNHVLGPELEPYDLKGKVVVFEYWGDRCPPCIAAIPGIVKLRSEYSTDKLAIVANQVWNMDDEKAVAAQKTKAAWTKAGGDESVTVINHGGLKDAEVPGVPHAFVLDHNGNVIWRGHPANKEMKKAVKKAVAALPDKA